MAGQSARTDRLLVAEVADLATTLPGLDGSLIRLGAGEGPSQVTVRHLGEASCATVELGFPLMGELRAATDSVVVALVVGLSGHARWDGVDLRPGLAVVYPPGGLHQAVNSAGMRIGLLVARLDPLRRMARDLGMWPIDDGYRVLSGTAARELRSAHRRASHHIDAGPILAVLAGMAATGDAAPQTGRSVSSRTITSRAIEHLRATDQWLPSIPSLCRATAVSERRLEMAFHDVYGLPPTRFLRQRALSEARTRLSSPGRAGERIGTIAHDLGFRHLGRFADYYRSAFGELPSETGSARRPDQYSATSSPWTARA